FTPNYGGVTLFSKKGFHFQFDHDVFQYRILSKYLLLKIDELVGKSISDKDTESRIRALAKNASQPLYYSFFYLNTFFSCLTGILLALLLHLKNSFRITHAEKYLV